MARRRTRTPTSWPAPTAAPGDAPDDPDAPVDPDADADSDPPLPDAGHRPRRPRPAPGRRAAGQRSPLRHRRPVRVGPVCGRRLLRVGLRRRLPDLQRHRQRGPLHHGRRRRRSRQRLPAGSAGHVPARRHLQRRRRLPPVHRRHRMRRRPLPGHHRVRRQHLRRRGHLPGGRLAHLPRRRHLHGHLVRLQLHRRRQLPERLLLRPGHLPGQARPGRRLHRPRPVRQRLLRRQGLLRHRLHRDLPRLQRRRARGHLHAGARRPGPPQHLPHRPRRQLRPQRRLQRRRRLPVLRRRVQLRLVHLLELDRDAGLHLQRPRRTCMASASRDCGGLHLRRQRLLHQLQQRHPVQRRATAARAPAASRWAAWCCTGARRHRRPHGVRQLGRRPPRHVHRLSGTIPTTSSLVPPVLFPDPASRRFNKTNRQAVRLAPMPSAIKPTTALTVSVWYRATNLTDVGERTPSSEMVSAGDSYILRVRSDGVEFSIRATTPGRQKCQMNVTAQLNNGWHHVAGVLTPDRPQGLLRRRRELLPAGQPQHRLRPGHRVRRRPPRRRRPGLRLRGQPRRGPRVQPQPVGGGDRSGWRRAARSSKPAGWTRPLGDWIRSHAPDAPAWWWC